MKQPSYQAIFEKYKSQNPDCVYFGATFDSNGGQLTKDKVSVLGDNKKVVLLAPDGFVGYPDFDALPESAGAYISFAGLSADTLQKQGGKPAEFANSFKDKYGKLPGNSYTLYAVAALQVILAGIEASDGTRAGLTSAVLGGSGITIPAADSVLGKDVHLDPATGDTVALDVTIMQEVNGAPTTLMPWVVQ
jgi:branched-chain amino acid transport system substrate-binding protein